MIIALIDNGSLEPAAHRHLRATAAALGTRCETTVHAVSWKHSDRIAPADLRGAPAWTLAAFVRAMIALGQRDFVFVPFFISAQGAIGSSLRQELELLRRNLAPFEFAFTTGLSVGNTLPLIATARVQATIAAHALGGPAIVLVDHGGPSSASAMLRNRVAKETHRLLGGTVASVAAASMEGIHPPLLAGQLRAPGFAGHDVIVAPLFLSPGRHAGPGGDLERICRASPARCHPTVIAGTHPLIGEVLSQALRRTLSNHLAPIPA